MHQVHPVLFESLKKIYCYPFAFENLREAMFINFKLSNRGAIRKPPNLITWMHSLEELRENCGDQDVNAIIRMWNAMASATGNLAGSKATALRLILGMPQPSKDALTDFTGRITWEAGPWTEEALSNKKLYPNSGARLGGVKAWIERLKVTDASLLLMIHNIHASHDALKTKRKMTKVEVEEVAGQAAFAHNVVSEIQALMPIANDVIDLHWTKKFEAADAKVCTEVLRHGLLPKLIWQLTKSVAFKVAQKIMNPFLKCDGINRSV